jgi:uncharacterized lipoprotein YddW (UPF0748 family)
MPRQPSDPQPDRCPGPTLDRRQVSRLGLAALAAWAGAALGACAAGPVSDHPPAERGAAIDQPPPAPREWRAAWIATVANIDWPARPGDTPAQQREQASVLLERASALGLNALILQVRPAADAFYPSALEPWSEYLSGQQGRAPEPAWDPLQFWIDEAHRRGIELHAWVNPYRARHASARSPLAAAHIGQRRSGLVQRYGSELWMDPGEPEAAEHSLAVIRDLVGRYDIDGIHLDDYFYPYPVRDPRGEWRPFPDEASWRRYRRAGGRMTRDDWRRDNVDRFVESLYREVHRIKPGLRVGLSPFGIGKPALRPPGIEGFSQFDQLYADVERWGTEGWYDYLAPQLYWPLDRQAQAFEVLYDYWLAQNPRQRHVWPGLFSSQVGDARAKWPVEEILRQIEALRQRSGDGGHIHFSMRALVDDATGLALALQAQTYAAPALVPTFPWLPAPPPPSPPELRDDGKGWRLIPGAGTVPWRWAVWRAVEGHWRFAVQPGTQDRLEHLGAQQVVVSAIDRHGQESVRIQWAPGLAPRRLIEPGG